MENIVFSLEERKKIKDFIFIEEDLNTFLEAVPEGTSVAGANVIGANVIGANVIGTNVIGTNVEELEYYYKTNYNAKSLQQILQYYGIPKKNMTKDEMLQCLLFFEMEQTNREMVVKRMRLWQNIRELKADTYFAKYINFTV